MDTQVFKDIELRFWNLKDKDPWILNRYNEGDLSGRNYYISNKNGEIVAMSMTQSVANFMLNVRNDLDFLIKEMYKLMEENKALKKENEVYKGIIDNLGVGLKETEKELISLLKEVVAINNLRYRQELRKYHTACCHDVEAYR